MSKGRDFNTLDQTITVRSGSLEGGSSARQSNIWGATLGKRSNKKQATKPQAITQDDKEKAE